MEKLKIWMSAKKIEKNVILWIEIIVFVTGIKSDKEWIESIHSSYTIITELGKIETVSKAILLNK